MPPGSRRYLDQAALFVERRGTGTLDDIELGRAYYQDDVPVREATVLRGHAVRANYLAAGAVDVAVETDDTDLLDALTTQWENTVARRTYVTGGQGSQHEGEAFGNDFVLPADRAYSETCAGIGSVMFSWRLLLAQGLPRYADLVERTLFNVVATSPSHEGTAFYYTNTLHQRVPGSVPPTGRREPPGVVVAARTLVRRVVLPAERCPHAGQPGGVRRDHRRRRPPAAPVRALPHPHDAGGRAARGRSTSRRPTRATGWSACGWRPRRTGPGR